MRKAMSLGVVALAGLLASPAFADEFTGFRIGIGMSSDKLAGSTHTSPRPRPRPERFAALRLHGLRWLGPQQIPGVRRWS